MKEPSVEANAEQAPVLEQELENVAAKSPVEQVSNQELAIEKTVAENV